MNSYSPLHNFATRIENYEFSDHLSIKPSYELNYQIDDDGYFISTIERNDISLCRHWVIINNSNTKLDEQIILNTLLIAFWIQSANKVAYKYIFKDSEPGCNVIYSRFEFNEMDNNKSDYSINDLNKIKEYYNTLLNITTNNGRLHTALSNTFQGCIAFNWKTAFLSFSAAIEAILNYEKGFGITKRLSKTYACLAENDPMLRKNEYDSFYRLYNIRSEIMHGNVNQNLPNDNLIYLSKLADALRKIWQIVISNNQLIQILENNDSERKIYFKKIEHES